jgi:thymidylate synthase ThyX
MVNVKLAGMNVPLKILDELVALWAYLVGDTSEPEAKLHRASEKINELTERFTPEVISAAYARISRDPADVNELLEKAMLDVSKARKSNESIIFGLGHHSVADHALFNFNITGISRLAIEEFEKRRIGSGYTEKSQRYINLDGDYVKPKEFSLDDLKKFEALVAFQNEFYFRNNGKLFEFLQKKFSDKIPKMDEQEKKDFINKLKGSAKEDARYSLCLATEAQFGCSYNGEALEHMIRNGKYSRLLEVRDASQQLFDQTASHAPSLIQLADAEVFRKHNPGQELKDDDFNYTEKNLRELVGKSFGQHNWWVNKKGAGETDEFDDLQKEFILSTFYGPAVFFEKKGDATLIKCQDVDLNIMAAVLHEYSDKRIQEAYGAAIIIKEAGLAENFIKQALKHLSQFDKVPRAFEFTGGLMYEAIVSSSCFAQLKRHRMMTLLSQDYNPELGFTMPPNIQEAGMGAELEEVTRKSSELYNEFLPKYGKAAEYCLTNAHKRRVLVGMNMRQLYHFSRTREDAHAQWEIRGLANNISDLASEDAPVTSLLLGGQHEFNKVHQKVYNPE